MATVNKQVNWDLAIVGAGPGGYVAAIRASQLGLKAVVIEKDKPGGVCLNWGCIPSKALIHQAELYLGAQALQSVGIGLDMSGFDYQKIYQKSRLAADTLSKGVEFLLKKNKVEWLRGHARIVGPNELQIEGGPKLRARYILIATGSRPAEIPGFKFDEQQVLSSTGLLMLQKLPKRLTILGAGVIGMEFAHVMNSFGVEVTVIEMLDRILPTVDGEVAEVLAKDMRRRGIRLLTASKALGLKRGAQSLSIPIEGPGGKQQTIEAEKLLVAVGRQPNSADIGLDRVSIPTERGFIVTGDYYRTAVDSIYAIGDVSPSPFLAHVASKEAEIAVEHIAGQNPISRLPEELIPSAVYTEPEIGSFGLTEEQLKERNIPYEKSVFPYRGAGKSVAVEQPAGLVKLLYEPATHELLAAHIVGKNATELIHELLLAKQSELLTEEIATMVHAHPTLSEAVMEAARGAEGWMIHF